jgi:selenide,water dikinase
MEAARDKAPQVSRIDRGEVLDGFDLCRPNRLLAALEELGVTLVETRRHR